MKLKPTVRSSNFAALLPVSLLTLISTLVSSFGASINYGNFGPVGPGLTFLQVTESSGTDPVPLYGPPTPFVTGVDFDPPVINPPAPAFTASANGGGVDLTDGQLNFTIHATSPGVGISVVSLSESGLYSLSGVGTAATTASIGAILRATITEIDGVDVAPIALAPSNASVGFNLLANPGVDQPWSLGIGLNIVGQLPIGQKATEVEVVIDNVLVAVSERETSSTASKNDFRITITTDDVPETGSTILLLGGAFSLIVGGRDFLSKRLRKI
jgi:hypothetical protein